MTYTVNTVAEMEALTASAGDICYVTDTTSWYTYDGAAWTLWYKERPSLAFQGITLEEIDNQTMAFQGITLEEIDNRIMVFQGITLESEVISPDLLFFGIV